MLNRLFILLIGIIFISSCSNNPKLPFGATIEYRNDFEGGPVIWDEAEMSLVGKGVVYFNYENIEIDHIIGFGFNNDKLIAHIEDVKGERYYFEYKENLNDELPYDLEVLMVNNHSLKSSMKNLEWVEIEH